MNIYERLLDELGRGIIIGLIYGIGMFFFGITMNGWGEYFFIALIFYILAFFLHINSLNKLEKYERLILTIKKKQMEYFQNKKIKNRLK